MRILLTDVQEFIVVMHLLEVASKVHGFGRLGAWFSGSKTIVIR